MATILKKEQILLNIFKALQQEISFIVNEAYTALSNLCICAIGDAFLDKDVFLEEMLEPVYKSSNLQNFQSFHARFESK